MIHAFGKENNCLIEINSFNFWRQTKFKLVHISQEIFIIPLMNIYDGKDYPNANYATKNSIMMGTYIGIDDTKIKRIENSRGIFKSL